jgi:hypothetical protein
MYLKEIGYEVMDRIQITQTRVRLSVLLNTVINLLVEQITLSFLTNWATVSHSVRNLLQGVGCLLRILIIYVLYRDYRVLEHVIVFM